MQDEGEVIVVELKKQVHDSDSIKMRARRDGVLRGQGRLDF